MVASLRNWLAVFAALLAVFVLTTSCSRTKPATEPTSAPPSQKARALEFSVPVQGEAHSFHFDNGTVLFCTGGGARKLDLRNGQVSPSSHPCAQPPQADAACSDLDPKLDVDVRSPAGEADDVVDVKGNYYPLKGRVHDCAAFGKWLAVVTGTQAVLIDMSEGTQLELGHQAGNRIAVSSDWIAWTVGTQLRVVANPYGK